MILRALEPEDLELLYTIENDRPMWMVSSQTAPYSRYQLRDYISNNASDIYKDEQVRFVIEDDGKAVGTIDLFNFSPVNSRAEMGVALLKEAQGKGLAQMAIKEIIRYAEEIVGIHSIYCIVPVSNTASIHMLQKTGFSLSAELKQWIKKGQTYENALIMQFFCK